MAAAYLFWGALSESVFWGTVVGWAVNAVVYTQRYAHRHDVRYVSEDMGLVLRILFGSTFALAMVALGCHFATRDMQD